MDRISQLPESIVHHILSFLNTLHGPPTELVRMSVLSKDWFHLTASFPVLDFSIHRFTYRETFFKYVEYTTSRFCYLNIPAHKLMLVITIRVPAELDIVNTCLERVLDKGVTVLEIDINNMSRVRYRLPNILLSVSMLKSLTIHGCELPSSFMVDDVKFKSLIKLRLVNVQINDEVIKYLTASCPLLQVFCIRGCFGFQKFCIYGHQNLLDVCIGDISVERIDIEAPNLSSLSVILTAYGERRAPQMNLASCKKLKTVSYIWLSNLNGNTDFLSNFPFAENLCLVKFKCNNLKISSHSLRTLVLCSESDLEDVEFKTPNLVYLISCSLKFPERTLIMDIIWPLVKHSSHLKSACMKCYPDGCIDVLWFQKLRQFLDKKNGFNVLNLYIHASNRQIFIELEKLKAIELPPYELEHVELQLDSHEQSSALVAFMGALLWCFRPQSLTIRSSFLLTDSEKHNDVIKFTYQKLLEQEDQSHTNIQIVSRSSSEAQKHLRDFKSLSMALPRAQEGETVTFIKEEGTLSISKFYSHIVN